MSVECNITKDNADFYVEAYTEYVANGEAGRTRLAYVAVYRDYERFDPTENALLWLELRDKVREVYSGYQDGEVVVKLVIKEDFVNI